MSTLRKQVIQSLNGLSDDNLKFLLDMIQRFMKPAKSREEINTSTSVKNNIRRLIISFLSFKFNVFSYVAWKPEKQGMCQFFYWHIPPGVHLRCFVQFMAFCIDGFDFTCVDKNSLPLYIATNANKIHGAAVILYKGLLEAVAKRTGSFLASVFHILWGMFSSQDIQPTRQRDYLSVVKLWRVHAGMDNAAIGINTDAIQDFSFAKDKICYKLVNRELNAGFLSTAPYRDFHGLAVAYYNCF